MQKILSKIKEFINLAVLTLGNFVPNNVASYSNSEIPFAFHVSKNFIYYCSNNTTEL